MDSDVGVEIAETEAAAVAGGRGQGSPSAVGVGTSPTHPCGTPGASGRPHPTMPDVAVPAAVMEWSPTPGIV